MCHAANNVDNDQRRFLLFLSKQLARVFVLVWQLRLRVMEIAYLGTPVPGFVFPFEPFQMKSWIFSRGQSFGEPQHSESDSFAELEQWIVEHLNTDLGVETLARRVHMSPRNFARVYAQTRGRTPATAVEAIRIDVARRRLEETTDRIETVAEHTGFTGEEQMRTAFIRSLGIPPREYRKRFASTAS